MKKYYRYYDFNIYKIERGNKKFICSIEGSPIWQNELQELLKDILKGYKTETKEDIIDILKYRTEFNIGRYEIDTPWEVCI